MEVTELLRIKILWLVFCVWIVAVRSQSTSNQPLLTDAATNGTTQSTSTQLSTTIYWTLEKGLETQPYWLTTFITVASSQDVKDVAFMIGLEQGLAEAYHEGRRQDSQEAREIDDLLTQLDPDINPLVMDRRKKRATTHRGYTVQLIDQLRDADSPTSVEIVFYVTEDGTKYKKVPSAESAATYQRLSLQELTIFIGYPVEETVKDYNAVPTQQPPTDSNDNDLWIIAVVLIPIFMLFLCVCFCCCCLMNRKRDTDIDPDTLKIIQHKQKYPYRPYPSTDTPRPENGIDNKVNGSLPSHTDQYIDTNVTRKADGAFVPSDTESSINGDPYGGQDNTIIVTTPPRVLPQKSQPGQAGVFEQVVKLQSEPVHGAKPPPKQLPPLESEESIKLNQSLRQKADLEKYRNKVRQRQQKKSKRKKGVGPCDDDFDDQHRKENESEDGELGPPDTDKTHGPPVQQMSSQEITKLLIVPVTKVPDNGGGVVWNTYDALDEIDRMSGNQKPGQQLPRQLTPIPPVTVQSPRTGTLLTLQESEPPQTNIKKPKLMPWEKRNYNTPYNSHTKPLTISQLHVTPGNRSKDANLATTPGDGSDPGELSSPQMTDSLEMGTKWAEPAFLNSLDSGSAGSTAHSGNKINPVPNLCWSLNDTTPGNEIQETKTPREHVELDMLSSSKLERKVGKPTEDDFDEMDVANAVKTGENPQPLIRTIREELLRLQRRGNPVTEL
ncbi:uncharacterized protein LOC144448271 isoform X2 [Glandiceps talaboti]